MALVDFGKAGNVVLPLCFCALVWLPSLGCKAQQELLGVDSAEPVVDAVHDAVLLLALLCGMQASAQFVKKRTASHATSSYVCCISTA